MDPAVTGERAAELARSMAVGPDSFAWCMVDKVVESVRIQGARLAERFATNSAI
jgi:hypothetical protein